MKTSDFQSVINAIEAHLTAPQMVCAINRLLAPQYQKRIKEAIARMRRKTAYIAVIGSQGCGKSTLLNGLIFGRHILPIGEGVTTNVLSFIHGADSGREYCRITFQNGSRSEHPLTLEALRGFMDERNNPNNEKNVERIDCYAASDLLSENTCFVDTLGIGSLLAWQDDVTMSFINDISLGIFVLRTTPTLKQDQADFLRRVWPSCPEMLFVQNVWGESAAEIEAAKQDNLRQLNALAAELGIKHRVLLLPVDIHAGLNQPVLGGAGRRSEHSISQLSDVIEKRVDRGGQRLEIEVQGNLIMGCLDQGVVNGRNQIKINLVESKEAIECLMVEIEEVQRRLDETEERSRDLNRQFRRNVDGILNRFRSALEADIEDLRCLFNRRVASTKEFGSLGEEYKAKLSDRLTHLVGDVYLSASDLFHQYIKDSKAEIASINKMSLPTLDSLTGVGEDDVTELSKLAGRVLYKAGNTGLVGLTAFSISTFASAMAGGGSVVAAMAAASATVPVIGWVVAGAVLGFGVIFKGLATSRARAKLLQEFDAFLRDVESVAGSKIPAQINADFDMVHRAGSTAIQAALAQMRETLEALAKQLRSKENVSQENIGKLKRDVDVIESGIAGIGRELERVGT